MHCSSTLLSCDHHCLLYPPGKPRDNEQSPSYIFVQYSQVLPVSVGCLLVSEAVQCCNIVYPWQLICLLMIAVLLA